METDPARRSSRGEKPGLAATVDPPDATTDSPTGAERALGWVVLLLPLAAAFGTMPLLVLPAGDWLYRIAVAVGVVTAAVALVGAWRAGAVPRLLWWVLGGCAVLWLWAALSLLWTPATSTGLATLWRLTLTLGCVAVYAVAAAVLGLSRVVREAAWGWCLALWFGGLLALVEIVFGVHPVPGSKLISGQTVVDYLTQSRGSHGFILGTFGNPNAFAALAVLGAAICPLVLFLRPGRGRTWGATAAIAAAAMISIWSLSRFALIGLVISIAGWAVVWAVAILRHRPLWPTGPGRWRPLWWQIGGTVAGIAVAAVVGRAAVAIFGGGLGLDAALNQFGLDYAASDQGRIDLTRLALSTGIESAGRGAGVGAFPSVARAHAGEYHYRTLTNAHNAAAELFAELGVVGAGLLVALVVLVAVVAVRVLLRRGSAQLGGTVACAALVALLGVGLASVLPGSFLNTTLVGVSAGTLAAFALILHRAGPTRVGVETLE